jgi:HEAT repeat protein/ATP/ADP translocase
MKRLAEFLKIHPGEGRMAALLMALMLCAAAGSSIGGASIDALFFARFGVEFLPYLYVALGVVTFLNLMAVTVLLGRVSRERLYLALPLVLALILVGERALIALNLNWFYPVVWLGKDVMNALQGLVVWGLAGRLCDTRQAKRLFPLFTSGTILGTVIGSSSTPFLVRWLHSENMLLVWAGALGAAFVISGVLVGRARTGAPARPSRRAAGSRRRTSLSQPLKDSFKEMQQGYHFVRHSPLLRWISVAAVLFSVLWFSLLLPFSRAATERFPEADALASFFATFQSLFTVAALLTSLFLANRLFARFGLMNMLLVYPAIYFAGFSVLALLAIFPVLVVSRFVKLVWSQGIAETVWQALFNVIPPERRDQTRAFINGVPGQAGIVIAGLILVVGDRALQPQQLYFIGLGAAALTLFTLWRAKRAYHGALVEALRAGQPQIFFSEEEPFGGFQQDAAAVAAVVAGLSHPDPAIRRVSVEILGHLSVPQAAAALVGVLRDPEAQVRASALRGLARAHASAALLDVAACLNDPEPDVREQAVEALRQLVAQPQAIVEHVRPLLDDPDPCVRARAALALLRAGPALEAEEALKALSAAEAVEARVEGMRALGEWGAVHIFDLAAGGLRDPFPPVRQEAAQALPRIDAARAVDPLIRALGDHDRSVREAAASALGQIGASALPQTVAALSDPALEGGALRALERLPVQPAAAALRAYVRDESATALRYHDLLRHIAPEDGDDRLRLLAESLHSKAQRHAAHALRVIGLLGDRAAMALAIENLNSRDAHQRANALETLEAAGEAEVVRPLLRVWETGEAPATPSDGVLLRVMQDADAWLRACAALAAHGTADSQLRSTLTQLAQSDPDEIVREAAASALPGGHTMDTLPTLSLMERILFLRRVPIFADLPPADLKQVAAIAAERFYPDGETITAQGDPGDEMYIIVSGEVRVMTETGEGIEVEVARRKPGEYVGEMAIISREPRMATLAALGEVRTLCIDQKQFESLLRERPEISLAVMRVLCARLKERPGPGRLQPQPQA